MKSKNLLSQLTQLETSLNSFSFEELSAKEASSLKKSYDKFKRQLELRIWGENPPEEWTKKTEYPAITDAKYIENIIAKVSHEMRTPLTGIMGFTELLRQGNLDKNELFQVNAIASSSRQLLAVLNELLEHSKLVMNKSEVEIIDFNFYELIQDAIHLSQTLLIGKEVRLQVDVDKNIPEVLKGSPSKLSQILLNLLSNSIKFTKHGSVRILVKLLNRSSNRIKLRIVVSDSGIGIARNDLDRIFESFEQVYPKESGNYGGIGLGLSIVKQIVEQLNGVISVESKVGVGTSIATELDLEVGSSSGRQPSTVKNSSSIKGAQILILEDNPLTRQLLEQRLKLWGCKAHLADNAIFGLKKLDTTSIDVILLDLKMPLLSGYEVVGKIRNHPNKSVRKIPIIAITADDSAQLQKLLQSNSINDFILKPFDHAELHLKIANQLRDIEASGNVAISSIGSVHKVDTKSIYENLENTFISCEGDMEVLKEIVAIHKRNILEFIGRVRLGIKTNDFDCILDAIHKIRSGLSMMASQDLQNLVSNIHAVAKTIKDINKVQFLYDRFLMEYPKEERALDMAVKDLENKLK